MSRGRPVLLTERKIDAMDEGDELWDSLITGLHIRANKKGKSFLFYYTDPAGKSRRPVLAKYGTKTLTEARAKAKKWASMIEDGLDPGAETEEKPAASDLGKLEKRWEIEARKSEAYWNSRINEYGDVDSSGHERSDRAFINMKPQTISHYRQYWKQILKKFGPEKNLASFTANELQEFHDELSVKRPREGGKGPQVGGKTQANKIINFLGTVLRSAVLWELMQDEFAPRFDVMMSKIDHNKKTKRKRFLLEEHFPQFDAQLKKMREASIADGGKKRWQKEMAARADLIELLKFQGARLGEFMRGRLSWIDWSGKTKILRLPDSKNGAKDVELGDEACAVLKRMCEEWHMGGGVPGDDGDHIIRSFRKKGAPLKNPYKGWRAFLKEAGLPQDLMPHSLRHTMATVTSSKTGASMAQISSVLSHASTKTTEGYVQKMHGSDVHIINRANEAMRQMAEIKASTGEDLDLGVVPDYIRAQRENLKRLQETPPTAAAH